ncbi:MAG TPA: sigma-70 family RNA polymerase sigma factor [Terracidiphilus sp.]|nr:sigma-70 family RNA polymerase sigma factor [Terracidiphilus sp.]
MRPELVQAAELLQRNTPESVEEAIGLLQNTVYSFSMKICGHREDAEDTMQEVMYRSLRHLTKMQDPQALAAWLYTVTRNRCWRMRRKPAHAPAHTLSLDDLLPDDAELGRLLEDTAESPEGNVLHAEQHHLLHQAVLGIPAPLRMVLVLQDMEELSTEQVARVLGLQEGTVRVRLHRARLAVRKQMQRVLQGLPVPSDSAKSPSAAKRRASSRKGKRPEACRELFANLSEYMDGRVEPRTCDQMRLHIEGCPSCVAFLRDLRSAIDRCRSMEMVCDPEVALRLRSMLTREYLRMLGAPAGKLSAEQM